jgi:hypothetical protein
MIVPVATFLIAIMIGVVIVLFCGHLEDARQDAPGPAVPWDEVSRPNLATQAPEGLSERVRSDS